MVDEAGTDYVLYFRTSKEPLPFRDLLRQLEDARPANLPEEHRAVLRQFIAIAVGEKDYGFVCRFQRLGKGKIMKRPSQISRNKHEDQRHADPKAPEPPPENP